MPVYRLYQKVTHPLSKTAYEKTIHMNGYDIRHAVGILPFKAEVKKDLEKKYWSKTTDDAGRTLYIEITEEVKPHGSSGTSSAKDTG